MCSFPLGIFLTTIFLSQWAKESRQECLFLKLEHIKTYDKLAWNLFSIMLKIGTSQSFTDKVTLLFKDAIIVINLIGQNMEMCSSRFMKKFIKVVPLTYMFLS